MPTPDPWTPRSGLPPVGVPVPLLSDLTFTTVDPATRQGLLRQPAASIKTVWHGREVRLKNGTLLLAFEEGEWRPHHLFVRPTPTLLICRERAAQAIRAFTPAEVVSSSPDVPFGLWELDVITRTHSGKVTYVPQARPALQLSLWTEGQPKPTITRYGTVRGVLRELQALGQ